MRILLVHNQYQQPGGEDRVFEADTALLSSRGHNVVPYSVHNSEVSRVGTLALGIRTVWNHGTYQRMRDLIRAQRPDVIHVHNTLPLISPAVYHAAHAEDVPVVQTLHNYRLACPNALFFRNGHPCEDCLGQSFAWQGIRHACYRGSRVATGAVATMVAVHRLVGTWTQKVDAYIALTDFAKQKFIQAGLPSAKIIVKPNFMQWDPGIGDGQGGFALYVGRLSPEKGIGTLLDAWEHYTPSVPLRIIGDGPMAPRVMDAVSRTRSVEWLGSKSHDAVISEMKNAASLVFPSECYEGFPNTIAEAYAVGLPVVGSDLGAMASLIKDRATGLLFRPGDPRDLAEKIGWLTRHPMELRVMRQEARKEYDEKYSAERNYQRLMDIYRQVISNKYSRKGGERT